MAVLPLVNGSEDSSAEYLSDGITTSIINSLSQLPRLRVMARSTVFRYKHSDLDAQVIGRELGVRAVITGRVLQLGDGLIIRTELVDVDDGAQLWGEQYDRKPSDIIAVQEEIARSVVDKLRLKLTGSERKKLARQHTVNPEAYQSYLKGLYQVAKGSIDGNLKAIEYFNLALEADPAYAMAFCGMADAYIWLAHMYLHPRDAFPKAKFSIARALELDDRIAEAHSILAMVKMYYEYDWTGAEAAFNRALAINPHDATVLRLHGFYLSVSGHPDEAIAELKRAQEIDPLSIMLSTVLGWALYFGRRTDESIAQFRKTLDLAPSFYNAVWGLGQAYLQKRQPDEALLHFRRATEISGAFMPETIAAAGLASALIGQPEEARKALTSLEELSKRRHVSAYHAAQIYLGLGELTPMFECLEKSYEDRFGWVVTVEASSVWDEVRSDHRFQSFLRKINLGLPQSTGSS